MKKKIVLGVALGIVLVGVMICGFCLLNRSGKIKQDFQVMDIKRLMNQMIFTLSTDSSQ